MPAWTASTAGNAGFNSLIQNEENDAEVVVAGRGVVGENQRGHVRPDGSARDVVAAAADALAGGRATAADSLVGGDRVV